MEAYVLAFMDCHVTQTNYLGVIAKFKRLPDSSVLLVGSYLRTVHSLHYLNFLVIVELKKEFGIV